MTQENQIYGGNYTACTNYGVMRRPKDLKAGACIETNRCAEWKATLERAKPVDLAAAAQKLCDQVKPTPDQLLAQLNAVKP